MTCLTLSSENYAPTIDAARSLDIPIVLVDRHLPPDVGASVVLVDHKTGMKAAVRHLLDLGHRRIAIITGSTDIRLVQERIAAVHEAIAERGVNATHRAGIKARLSQVRHGRAEARPYGSDSSCRS